MRRPVPLFLSALAAILFAAGSFLTAAPVAAAPIADAPTTYCGDPDTDPSMDTGAGTMITCVTTVTNTITAIDAGTGVASGTAVVSVTECIGPASGRLDPSFLTCTTDLATLVNLVTRVDQCDEVGYGGGNVLECSVEIDNEFVGVTPAAITAATVDQCNGSAPDTTGCDPFPANTSGATITQCNDSSYGGGQEDFICTASGTVTASLSVTVNQCNNSNYGGGSWLTCSATVSNTIIAAPPAAPTPSPTVVTGTSPRPTPPPTDTNAVVPGPDGAMKFVLVALVALFLTALALAARRPSVQRPR